MAYMECLGMNEFGHLEAVTSFNPRPSIRGGSQSMDGALNT